MGTATANDVFQAVGRPVLQALLDNVADITGVFPALMDAATGEWVVSCTKSGLASRVCIDYVCTPSAGMADCRKSNERALREAKRLDRTHQFECDPLGFTEVVSLVRLGTGGDVVGAVFSGRVLRSEEQRATIGRNLEKYQQGPALDEARQVLARLDFHDEREVAKITESTEVTAVAIGLLVGLTQEGGPADPSMARRLRDLDRLQAVGAIAQETLHEVKNKIGSTCLRLAALQEILLPGSAYFDVVGQCLGAAESACEALARARDATDAFEPQEYDLAEALHEAVKSWQREWPKISVRIEVEGVVPPTRVDWEKLRRSLFDELMRNSADAMQDSGAVVVRMEATDQHVEVEWVDTGLGLPDGLLALEGGVFDPRKLRATLGDYHSGLAITKAVVARHGGDIRLDNAPSGGARVSVRLPR